MANWKSFSFGRKMAVCLMGLLAACAIAFGTVLATSLPGASTASAEPLREYAEISAEFYNENVKVYKGYTTGDMLKCNLVVKGTVDGDETEYVLTADEYTVSIIYAEGAQSAELNISSGEASCTLSATVEEAVPEYSSIEVTYTRPADGITDDYTEETIKEILTVKGDGTEVIYNREMYTVSFGAAGKLQLNVENTVTVKYVPNGAEGTVKISGVTSASLQSISISVNPDYIPGEMAGDYIKPGKDKIPGFVTGMSLQQVLEGLVVTAHYPKGDRVLSFNFSSTVPTIATGEILSSYPETFGVGTVSVSLGIKQNDGGEEKTDSIQLFFNEQKIVKIFITDGYKYTCPKDTYYSYSTLNSEVIAGNVYAVYNTGETSSGPLSASDYSLGDLMPSIEIFNNPTTSYAKDVTVSLVADSSIACSVYVENITYKEPDSIASGLTGTLAIQTAHKEFSYSGLSVEIIYKDNRNRDVKKYLSLTDILEVCTVKFYNSEDKLLNKDNTENPAVDINTAYAEITAIVGGTTVSYTYYKEDNEITINPDVKELPDFELGTSDFVSGLTKKFSVPANWSGTEADYWKDITNVSIFLDRACEDSAGDFATYSADTHSVTFNAGGQDFYILLKLDTGTPKEWQWASSTNQNIIRLNDSDVLYRVRINKGRLNLTLTVDEKFEYGTVPNATKVTATTVTGATQELRENAESNGFPGYQLLYYGWDKYTYDSPSEKAPEDVYNGKYYMIAKTVGDSDAYLPAKTSSGNAKSFEITPKLIELAKNSQTPKYKKSAYSLNDFIQTGSFAYDQSAEDVLTVSGDISFTDATDYAVTLAVIANDYKLYNYKLDDDGATEINYTFTIAPAEITYDYSAGNVVYGTENGNPNPQLSNIKINGNGISSKNDLESWLQFADVEYHKDTAAGTLMDISDIHNWNVGKYVAVLKASAAVGEKGSNLDYTAAKDAEFQITQRAVDKSSVVINVPEGESIYSGNAYTVTISNWDDNALKVETEGLLHDETTPITTNIVTGTDGTVNVIEAGVYTFTVSLKSTNYMWNDGSADNEKLTKSFTVSLQTVSIVLDPATFEFADGVVHNPVPQVSHTSSDGAKLKFAYEYYKITADGDELIDAEEVIAAGSYKILVKEILCDANIDGATYTYAVNYELPAKDWVEFTITEAELAKPTLNGGNSKTVDYKGEAYIFTDFIDNYENYTVNNKSKLTITASELRNAGDYTVKVKPATNYKWTSGGDEEVTFTVKIDKVVVILSWGNLNVTYNGAGQKPVANVTNLQGTDKADSVTVIVNFGTDILTKINAGTYIATAAKLDGEMKDNYTLDGATDTSKEFTIAKKAIAVPAINDNEKQFNASTQTLTFKVDDYSDDVTDWAWSKAASATVKSSYSVFDSSFTNEITYDNAFNFEAGEKAGELTFRNAGGYTVTFEITDTTNYYWLNDANETTNYSETVTFIVNRGEITAPALGEYRSMEWSDVNNDLISVLSGQKKGIAYKVEFGALDKSEYTGIYSYQVDGKFEGSAKRGTYFAKLTVTGADEYNYIWLINNNDKDSQGYLQTSDETFYNKDGASINIYYIITASQLSLEYEVYSYIYGNNGEAEAVYEVDPVNYPEYNNKLKVGAVTRDDIFVLKGDAENVALANAGTITFKFKTGHGDFTATDNELKQEEFVNGLPWAAGEYSAQISIVFADSETYQSRLFNCPFTVLPRPVVLEWDEKSLNTTFNGEEQKPSLSVTNLASGTYEGGTYKDAQPELTFNYTSMVNADTYNVTVKGVDNGNYTVTNGENLTNTFVIEKFELYIAANALNKVYGDEMTVIYNGETLVTNLHSEWSYVDSSKIFFNNDAKNITISLMNGSSAVDAKTPVGGNYLVVPGWTGADKTGVSADGKTYTLTTGNYIINVTAGDFTVNKRIIDVTLSNDKSSTYGNEVVLLNVEEIYKAATSNGTGNALVDDASGVFTLTLEKDGVAVTGGVNYKELAQGAYDLVCTCINDNYTVIAANGTYTVNPADINVISAEAYNGIYDAATHPYLKSNDAKAVNDQTVTWKIQLKDSSGWKEWEDYKTAEHYLKDVSAVEFKVKVVAPNHNEKELDGIFKTEVTRKTLYVQVNFTILYGEKSPVTEKYKMANTDLLAGTNSIYTITGYAPGEGLGDIDIDSLTGSFSYTTDYERWNNAGGEYRLKFEPKALQSKNYTFAASETDGVLTVDKLTLTVNVKEGQTAEYGSNVEDITLDYTVTFPESTYTGTAYVLDDFDGKIVYSDIFELSTQAFVNKSGVWVTNGKGNYPITVTQLDGSKTNYTVEHANAAGSSFEITASDNSFTVSFKFENNKQYSSAESIADAAWIYGVYSAAHTEGYNAAGNQKITDPVTLFGGEKVEKAYSVSIYKNGVKLTYTADDSVSALFASMINAGAFGAGVYKLEIVSEETDNYNSVTQEWYFKVGKKDITINADNVNLVYGDAKPKKFTYKANGLVNNGKENETSEDIIGTSAVYFDSTYVAGYANGSVGTHNIVMKDGVKAPELANYNVTGFTAGTIIVAKRHITVTIKNTENYYKYLKPDLENYVYINDEKVELLTLATVTSAVGIFEGDIVNGTQAVFGIKSEARVGDATNVVGKYPVYAVYLNDGAGNSYYENYDITVTGAYNNSSEANKIPANGIQSGAGVYEIKQTYLFYDVKAPDSLLFNNKPKEYKATIAANSGSSTGEDSDTLVIKYYVDGAAEALASAPVNVGDYQYLVTSTNTNYLAVGSRQPFPILPASLTVTTSLVEGKEVIYGTSLNSNLAYTSEYFEISYTCMTNIEANDKYAITDEELVALIADGSIDFSGITYTAGAYGVNSSAGSTFNIGLAGTQSGHYKISGSLIDNFTVSITAGSFTVGVRNIDVTVRGTEAGNPEATKKYTGLDPLKDWQTHIGDFLYVENGAFGDSGDTLDKLNITLSLPGGAKDVGNHPIIASGETNKNTNYNITFIGKDGNAITGAEPANRPTFKVERKELEVSAADLNVTYGDRVVFKDDLRYPGVVFDGFVNGESYIALLGSNYVTAEKFVFDTDYKPYASGVNDSCRVWLVTEGDGATALSFMNYEITYNAKQGNVKVGARVISAATSDKTYTEALKNPAGDAEDLDNKTFNRGVYGMAQDADISFSDHNTGSDYDGRYYPEFSLSYNTVASEGQTASAAPVKAGAYKVTVTLTNPNYVFEGNKTSLELGYEIEQKVIGDNFRWQHMSIGDSSTSGENSIERYISDMMTVTQFERTYMGTAYGITEYTIGEERKLSIDTGMALGEYRIKILLNESARNNYRWKNADNLDPYSITLIFNVTTQKIEITVAIDGWVYNKYNAADNAPKVNLSNGGDEELVQFAYANVDGLTLPEGEITGAWVTQQTTLRFSAQVPSDAGKYIVRALYPTIGDIGGDRVYALFEITKDKIACPELEGIADNSVYNGKTRTIKISYDATVMQLVYDVRLTPYRNGDKLELSATNASEYSITFRLLSTNYEWDTDGVTPDADGNVGLVWKINAAADHALKWETFANSITYGEALAPVATSNYGGIVSYRYSVSDGASANWMTWSDFFSVGSGLYKTGNFYVRANCGGNDNYNAAESITKQFSITKAELTVTPRGNIVYGDMKIFDEESLGFPYDFTGAIPRDGDVIRDLVTVLTTGENRIRYQITDTYTVLNAGTYGFVFKTDKDGNVIGMSADNYVVKTGTGSFAVAKNTITVTIGNASSEYGLAIDISEAETNTAVTLGSLANGDGMDALDIAFATSATENCHVGTYRIYSTGYDNDNYDVTFIDGVYSVTARQIEIEFTAGGGEYGGTIEEAEYSKVLSHGVEIVPEGLHISFVYSGTANDGTVWNSSDKPVKAGNYIATAVGSGNSDYTIIGTPYAQFIISKKTVTYGGKIQALTYNESEQTASITDTSASAGLYTSDIETVKAKNAGTYTVTLTLNDKFNMQWAQTGVETRTTSFVVNKALNSLTGNISIEGWIYGKYSETDNAPHAETLYDSERIVFTYSDSENGKYTSSAPAASDAGTYWVRVTVSGSDNLFDFESPAVSFKISPRTVGVPTLTIVTEGTDKNDVFTGKELLSAVVGYNSSLMLITYNGNLYVSGNNVIVGAVNAGTYAVKLALNNTRNYVWSEDAQLDSEGNAVLVWNIERMKIAKPVHNDRIMVVNGGILTYLPVGFDENLMTIRDNEYGYGGTFTATVALKDLTNYVWADGTGDELLFEFGIVGTSTLFVVVISSLSGLSCIMIITALAQSLAFKGKKRKEEIAFNERSEAYAENGDEFDSNGADVEKGGNE